MPLAPGTHVGPYEVIALIGAGGMGEVYRARDRKLAREVALKILPDTVASDPERLARFEREARTLAALNHQHLAQIYGFEQSSGVHALAMELVDGEDLSDRIARGPVPIDDALPIARQIAEAIEAAHELGIIHRDLKPSNIKVRADGAVKVLDFGLAKALEQGSRIQSGDSADTMATSPTITTPAVMTMGGMILGTAAYMSPEQAKGKPVDRRADIWAFGVVLYEMLTGRRAFQGDNVSETLASVLRDSPPFDRLPATTPAAVRTLLARCLDRDPRTRLRDIGEARIVLAAGAHPEVTALTRPAASWRSWAALAAGAALGAVGVAIALAGRNATPVQTLRKVPITVEGLDLSPGRTPVISPDGQRIAYAANGSLWVRDLSRADTRALPDTDNATGLFWSPDSTALGFIRDGRLWTMGLDGSQPTSVAVLPGAPCGEPGGLWRTNGRILLSLSCNSRPLLEVSAAGGDLVPAFAVDQPDERDVHHIAFLPGDRAVVLTLDRATGGVDTLITWDGTTRKTILQVPNDHLSSPVYSPTGHLLYQRSANNPGVWAVPFSADSLETTGEPFLVAAGMAAPSIARDGTLLVVPISTTGVNQLAWIDREGRIEARIDEAHPRVEHPRLSPDGRRVAFAVSAADWSRNIWIRNLADGARTGLTSGPALKWSPFWSPDGTYLYYDVEQPGRTRRIERQSSAGGSAPETIVDEGNSGTISSDGRWLVYVSGSGPSQRQLMKMRLDGDRQPSLLFDTPGSPVAPAISPNQRFIAYVIRGSATEDGLYVRRFPDGEGFWQLGRGDWPRWSPTGDRLYFSRENEIWQIDVGAGDPPTFGRAVRLFGGAEIRAWPAPYGYDVAADGRFLLVASQTQTAAPVMTLIDHWQLDFMNRR